MKNKIIVLTLGVIVALSSWQNVTWNNALENRKGMIKVAILYSNGKDKTFNMDYYSKKHMPMVADLLGDALKRFEIDEGIAGRTPDEMIPYLAIGYLYFDKLSDYQTSFGSNAKKIISDIPNYTNIHPIIQISEVLK